MNRLVTMVGVVVLGLATSMYVLLIQLGLQTFRADLPPWMDSSIGLAISGASLVLVGVLLPKKKIGIIAVRHASRYFGYLAVANTISAALFAAPVLIPSLEFPILITRWPGIYMVIAYSFFVLIGVIGMLAWAGFYRWLPEFLSRDSIYRPVFVFQIVSMEIAIYMMSIFMFLGGYVGSQLSHSGAGDAVVGSAMEFAVIPSALGIFLLIVSALIGVVNALLSGKTVDGT